MTDCDGVYYHVRLFLVYCDVIYYHVRLTVVLSTITSDCL